MQDVLNRIKALVLAERFTLTWKATTELEADGLGDRDVFESILGARSIYKRVRSTSFRRGPGREYLYIIDSPNWQGLAIYTKGKFAVAPDGEVEYVLISAKRSS